MRDPLEGISAGPIDEEDMYKWEGYIWGPDDSPYRGGVFFLDMEIPLDYPSSPPKWRFTTQIYHPNISSSGSINHPIYYGEWDPQMIISTVLLYMQILLTNPFLERPENTEAWLLYKNDREKYDLKAQEYTNTYA